MEFKAGKSKGLSLVESLVSFFVITVILATTMPVITTKSKAPQSPGGTSEPCLWSINETDDNLIYRETGSVSIGVNQNLQKLNIDGGIVAKGTFGAGDTLTTVGAGTRFIWYPRKAAIRAGAIDGTQWDDVNIGNYSVAFGHNTIAKGNFSVVSGGEGNLVFSDYGVIRGGQNNHADYIGSVVGGLDNWAVTDYSVVLGGKQNNYNMQSNPKGIYSAIGGGQLNMARADYAAISGGYGNLIDSLTGADSGKYSVIVGGYKNAIETATGGKYSAIVGGEENKIKGNYSFIGGGDENAYAYLSSYKSDDNYTTIGGGYKNYASDADGVHEDSYATVIGGRENKAVLGSVTTYGTAPFVGGGYKNSAIGFNQTVIGGYNNNAYDFSANVIGGRNNTAETRGTVGGGLDNYATEYSVVVGGQNNDIYGNQSVIGGGWNNRIDAEYSYIPGGAGNQISWGTSGEILLSSFAAGKNMKVAGDGSFAFGYSDTLQTFVDNYTVNLWGNGTDDNITLKVYGPAVKTLNGDQWSVSSDRRLKKVLGSYDKGLDEIKKLKPVKFKYKENKKYRFKDDVQVGLIAQDVNMILPEAVEEDNNGYLMLNFGPVSYSMINAVKELKDKNESLKKENEELEKTVKSLRNRLEKIKAQKQIKSEKRANSLTKILSSLWTCLSRLVSFMAKV